MNSDYWNKLSSIAEIVSSIAILITLIFLTVQVYQNTQAIEATTRQAALNSDTQFLVSAIYNPEIILTWSKPDPTDKDLVMLNEALILFFRNRENDFTQYKRGVMDEATWQRYTSSITTILMWERNMNWWNNFGQAVFDPEYVEEINKIITSVDVIQDETQVQDNFRALFGISN